MGNKRIHVRVPLRGEAVLSTSKNPTIKACTIDISQGGVAVTTFARKLADADYQIEILTKEGQKIDIIARLVRVDDSVAGFQTLKIDNNSLEIIRNLVFEYQKTDDFIKQVDEFDILEVVDEEGNQIDITFEKNCE